MNKPVKAKEKKRGKPFLLLRNHAFELLIFFVVLLSQLWIVFIPSNNLLNWFSTDDAFYYYKVAQNIGEGKGSTFDGVNLTNGYHPLWMLICIPVFLLARYDLILPLRCITLVCVVLTSLTGVVLFMLLKRVLRSKYIATASAFVFSFLPVIHNKVFMGGLESNLNAFSIVLLLLKASDLSERRGEAKFWDFFSVGLIAAFSILSRLDNIFLCFIVGIWLLFPRKSLSYYFMGFILASVVSVFLSFFLRLGFVGHYPIYLSMAYVLIAVSCLSKLIVGYFLGLTAQTRSLMPLRVLLTTFFSCLISGGVIFLFDTLNLLSHVSYSVVLIEFGVSFLLLLFVRFSLSRLPGAEHALSPLREIRLHGKQWLLRGLFYAIPIITLLGTYALFNSTVFDTAFPVSGQIKHWWGTIPDVVYGKPLRTFAELFGFPADITNSPWSGFFWFLPQTVHGWWLGLLVVILSMAALFFRRNTHSPIIYILWVACMIHVVQYFGSYYVGIREWYWIIEMVLAIMVWAFLFDNLVDILPKKVGSWLIPVFAALASVTAWSFFLFDMNHSGVNFSPVSTHQYIKDAVLLESNFPKKSVIGVTGSGAVGYFVRNRTILNLDGLINSKEYFDCMKLGDCNEFFANNSLQYVLGNSYMLTYTVPYKWLFENRLEPIPMVTDYAVYHYVDEP